MFDPGHVGQILVTILSHPAMAEVTALAGFAVSIAQSRKLKSPAEHLKKIKISNILLLCS